ncbi:MAG TPA: FKBP-type peptidyl-prolyl cis-trans isomerase [Chitinophagaceae bacterium]|nr:FKBP-type peptidyl-prolyl cis-trans isomerase [Chitinophagaceae bacterium]HNF72070.1 FKBP-type peptidyl-prolyl cis-trans isomerase [Chitinophagaceae bacterium]
MSQVKKGDTIQIHYKGTLSTDGTLFDSSEGREPLEFKVGEGMVIHGFDQGVLNMKIGEKKTLQIPFLEAYGPKNEQMFFEFEKDQLPTELGEPVLGMELHMVDPDGNPFPVIIHEIREKTIILDANHPLAGQDLTFEVELVGIVS